MKVMNWTPWLVVLTVNVCAGRHLHSGGNGIDFDCSSGCSTRLQVVTGSDGNMYVNKCLAMCQGVEVSSEPQPTAGGTIFGWPEENFDEEAKVSIGIITQFQSEGFKYIAKVYLYDVPMSPSAETDDQSRCKSIEVVPMGRTLAPCPPPYPHF